MRRLLPVLVGLLASYVVAVGPTAEADIVQLDPRPNILLITTDDMRLDDLMAMPLTQELLGDGGVTVSTGLSTHPYCCPARAQILTGQLAHNNGVRANVGRHGGYQALREPDRTIAASLRAAGYGTGFVGKFLNGWTPKVAEPAGWTEWHPFAGRVYAPYGVGVVNGSRISRSPETHSNDLVRDWTIRTVDELAGLTPFFVWSSYVAPHGTCAESTHCSHPPVPADRHRGLFADATNPAESSGSFNRRRANPFGVGVTGRAPTRDALTTTYRRRLQALASVDEGIAATLSRLDDLDELDNTLVIFTSDNGYLLGEHRFEGKNVPYEEALRVPFLVRGPGLQGGVVRDMTAALVDVAPTVLAAASADSGRSEAVAGVDLMPFLSGRRAAPRYTQLLDIGPSQAYGTSGMPWTVRGVRTGRYTLLRWQGTGRVQLFDRDTDPAQLTDVAGVRRYGFVRELLLARLDALVDCSGALECRRTFSD